MYFLKRKLKAHHNSQITSNYAAVEAEVKENNSHTDRWTDWLQRWISSTRYDKKKHICLGEQHLVLHLPCFCWLRNDDVRLASWITAAASTAGRCWSHDGFTASRLRPTRRTQWLTLSSQAIQTRPALMIISSAHITCFVDSKHGRIRTVTAYHQHLLLLLLLLLLLSFYGHYTRQPALAGTHS